MGRVTEEMRRGRHGDFGTPLSGCDMGRLCTLGFLTNQSDKIAEGIMSIFVIFGWTLRAVFLVGTGVICGRCQGGVLWKTCEFQ